MEVTGNFKFLYHFNSDKMDRKMNGLIHIQVLFLHMVMEILELEELIMRLFRTSQPRPEVGFYIKTSGHWRDIHSSVLQLLGRTVNHNPPRP